LINVFKVKFVLTLRILAYCIAFFSSSRLKLLAKALALYESAPKYTLSAPFCTAAFKHSKFPNGRK